MDLVEGVCCLVRGRFGIRLKLRNNAVNGIHFRIHYANTTENDELLVFCGRLDSIRRGASLLV